MSIAGAREHLRAIDLAVKYAQDVLSGWEPGPIKFGSLEDARREVRCALTELSAPLASHIPAAELEEEARDYNECLRGILGAPAARLTTEERQRARATVGP